MSFKKLIDLGIDSLSLTPTISRPAIKEKEVTGKDLVESAWNEVGRCLTNACHLKVKAVAHGKRAKKRDRVC